MKQIYPDLWQTKLEIQYSVLKTHAFFLERPEGNVLFYNTGNLEDLRTVLDLGGIAYQYLSHGHEVNSSLVNIKNTFNSKLCCHRRVERYLKDIVAADIFFETPPQEYHTGDIEIIHTPGHTDNNVCFYYKSPHGKNYLFTGDTIYLDQQSWNILIMPDEGGSQVDLVKSLLLLRDLMVDVIICSVAVGDHEIIEVTPTEWQRVIDKLVSRLSKSH